MQKDIKKIVKKEFENSNTNLPKNHQIRFEERLKNELHFKKKTNFFFLKIASSFLILLSLGIIIYTNYTDKNILKQNYTLGSLSPELEKIEEYYTNAITYELTQLEINTENQPILDKYFDKLEQLTTDYKKQSTELNIHQINEKTINALIDNLQLRLQLLLQLKEQLNNHKIKTNENNKI
jgi:hypothetical protein